MTKKSLQGWYNSGEINYSEKEIIKRFGVGDYYPECAKRDFKKLWHYNEIFERNKYKIPRRIVKWVFLSTDWNNNVIICVSDLSNKTSADYYYVWLGVCELKSPKSPNIPEIFNFYELFSFVNENSAAVDHYLNETKRKIVDNNPIYSMEMVNTLSDDQFNFYRLSEVKVKYEKWYLDEWNKGSFPSYYKNNEVMAFDLPYELAKSNPDAYIKPLDIVKVFSSKNDEEKMERLRHVCIYLGKRKIAHALADKSIRLEDWERFFDVYFGKTTKMIRYHPVIAFKKPEKIIEHIAKCIENSGKYFSPEVKFGFDIDNNNNCESFANRCVLGLDFSELSDKRNGKKSRDFSLRDQHKKNEEKMNLLTSGRISDRKEEIRGYVERPHNASEDGIKMEGQIEVSPKGCYWYNG